eukprot:GHVN01092474.1.p1 GENE.GHVN01092474.1~~GHVN01092474.1.p1  ORF type:complete len:162 (+),score=30.06 GHVN01092474.1:166-651(+)
MGASESHDNLAVLDLEMKELEATTGKDELQDAVYPWFHIIQWSCEDSEPRKVFKWDYSSIKKDVEGLCPDAETWLKRCPKDKIDNFTMDDSTTFVEWASVLLKQVPHLNDVRFRLVPCRVPEERFWERFFAAIRAIVREHVRESDDDRNSPAEKVEGAAVR